MRTLYRVQKSGYVVTVCPQSKCLSAFAGEIASTKTCDVSLGFQAKEQPAEQGFMRLRGDFVTESQVVEGV